jgi:hypothetical protein
MAIGSRSVKLCRADEKRAEELYGRKWRQIRRWLDRGATNHDACPLLEPEKMPNWWTRNFQWRVPAEIEAAAIAALKAKQSPSDPATEPPSGGASASLPEPLRPINLEDFDPEEGDRLRELKQIQAAKFAELKDRLRRARAFTPPPDIEIWEWADENVLLQNEDAAEPGEYRSAKTPWTKRIQELIRRPEMWVWRWDPANLQSEIDNLKSAAGRYVRVPVTEINVQKSSQSGYSEAALNGIRWRATFRPCNVIYAIDSADEARKIARRLLRSFKFLDQSIFTGDPDDIKTLEFQLRGMELFFYGSFSSGKFANKQAPLNINDEVEEHGKDILADSASRKKTSTGGLQINLSKPKLKGGPINRAFTRGNQEEFFVPCPHCHHLQYLTFFPEERDVPFSEDFIWVNKETGENLHRRASQARHDGPRRLAPDGD